MDILDRLLGHDAWTGRQLLLRCRSLSDDQLDQPFDLGVGGVRATLQHCVGNVEVWTALMAGGPLPERTDRNARPSVAALLARHDAASAALRTLAERIAAEGRLDDLWLDRLDDPPREKTYGGAIAHVLTHNHFHRAELLHMLARLGLTDLPEGDVLGWEQQTRGAAS
jgi:uncharacterized damage-inducible protein DinB